MQKNRRIESLFFLFFFFCHCAVSVNSVSVLEKFLPHEYRSLISRARTFSTKKEIHLAQCYDFDLIEDGSMSFCIDKESGKSCIMLSPKRLQITWLDGHGFWKWISIPESRFEKVPELVIGVPFKIYGFLNAEMLSLRTRYSAYIVYKTIDQFPGYKSIGTGVIRHGPPEDRKWERMYLTKIEEREDGWMEVKFGEFINEGLDYIWFSIDEINYSYWTPGFIIQGIEFRPVKNEVM